MLIIIHNSYRQRNGIKLRFFLAKGVSLKLRNLERPRGGGGRGGRTASKRTSINDEGTALLAIISSTISDPKR